MIAPTFVPGGEAGELSRVAADQETTNQSWMDRAQKRQQLQLEIDQKIRELPADIMRAHADQAEQESRIQKQVLLQEVRRRAAIEAPKALAKFLDITAMPDLDERAAALDAFSGEIAWLGNVPENKGFIDSVNDTRAKAHVDSIAMGKIAQAKEATLKKAETSEKEIEGRAKIAELKAATDVQMKAMQAEVERMKQENANLRNERTTSAIANRPANQIAAKVNEEMSAAGRSAQKEIGDVTRGLDLLEEVRTGTGARQEQAMNRLGQIFGFDSKTAKPEELQRILGDAVLKRVNQTKGSISDTEMKLFDQYSASMNKSAEGNKVILAARLQALNRDVKIAQMVNDLGREGASPREIQLEVDRYVLHNPLKFDGTIPKPSGWNQEKEDRYNELKNRRP